MTLSEETKYEKITTKFNGNSVFALKVFCSFMIIIKIYGNKIKQKENTYYEN